MNEISSQVTAGAIVVWAIQQLKASNWCPWLKIDTDTLNRIVAVILAAATASGIIVTYGWADSTFTFTAAGLTPLHIVQFLWQMATSVAIQELVYRTAVKK